MANVVNMNSLLNGKDSRWLQLEVCREFQRNKCSRQDTECKFAHPPANVEVQNGKVTACYDSIKATQLLDMDDYKGRCNRDKPPCKYFHPPQHLKDQLLINGRNHLALKNALMQQMGIAPGPPVISGQVPAVATNPYLTGIPANTYSPYYAGHLVPTLLGHDPTAVASQLGTVVPQTVQVAQQKIPRSDRLEVCREFLRGACKRAESECRFAHPQESVARHDDGSITVCMDAVKGRCARDPCRYFHPPLHLQAQLKAAQTRATAVAAAAAQFSGMVPFKRPAAEKSGIPVYQPGATAYQQLMQPYVPVSSNTKMPPLNASCVIYTDASGQLLDTLPVCQDFNRSMCSRLNCRFVHLTEDDKVEVIDQRVAVCRDHANSQCRRKQCKYYHIPIVLPPANIMAAMITNPSEQQAAAGSVVATTTAAAVAAGYNNSNNNLIIIEPHQQQQQPQQQQQQQPQQQYSYHTNNTGYYHSNTNKAAAVTHHASNMYQQHHHQQQQQQQQLQQQQQQQHITYHCSSPYSPSSASSSSSCSIATSPTLSSATTLSTTSTATMPTPQQQYAAAAAAAPTAAFLKAPAYYTDATPTLVLSSDYNSNCIPIQAAPFISLPQQHVLKYATPQQQQQQQHHSLIHHQQHAYVGHHYPVVATTVAALPATTITVTPATIAAPSSCI
ncbi:muscleblind-like protein 2 isoform X21 [Drosophila montana]|uniref:muscleblind-like protein 2 isoform X21 n=1 Tax=Drosophila montana TaxID=40370 RepID=UPI00313C3D5A